MSMPQDRLAERDAVRRVDDVTDALARLTAGVQPDEELPVILQRVCRQVVRGFPDTAMASITLLRDGAPYTAAATDDGARRIDEAQYDAGQGPCLDAARSGELQRAGVGDAARRWPKFTAVAVDAAVAGWLSAPLFIDREYQGSLNLYGTAEEGYGTFDAALLELYTTAAEAALRAARRFQTAQETIEQLHTALRSRAVIDQAKGVLMALHRVTADNAFDLLVKQSQDRNVKVREVAERFISDILDAAG